MDTNARAYLMARTADEWLSLRLDVIGATIVLSIALLNIIFRWGAGALSGHVLSAGLEQQAPHSVAEGGHHYTAILRSSLSCTQLVPGWLTCPPHAFCCFLFSRHRIGPELAALALSESIDLTTFLNYAVKVCWPPALEDW